MGNNSKAVITGDITQIDLPNPRKVGPDWTPSTSSTASRASHSALRRFRCVRHPVVQRIVRAYESASAAGAAAQLGDAIQVGVAQSEDRAEGRRATSETAIVLRLQGGMRHVCSARGEKHDSVRMSIVNERFGHST